MPLLLIPVGTPPDQPFHPGPAADHVSHPPRQRMSPCLISASPVVGWGGGPRGGGEVNLIVVLYGHLNLPGLPPRAKNNPETQLLCPAHREDPAICFGSEPCVCLSVSPPHSLSILVPASGHDPLLICRVLFPLSLLPCTLQVNCASPELAGLSPHGPVSRGHAEIQLQEDGPAGVSDPQPGPPDHPSSLSRLVLVWGSRWEAGGGALRRDLPGTPLPDVSPETQLLLLSWAWWAPTPVLRELPVRLCLW